MHTYTVTDTLTRQMNHLVLMIGQIEPIQYDYSPWADDNGNVTTGTITVESGDASVGNESLTSNVKSFTVTGVSEGTSLLKVVGTGSTNQHVTYLQVKVKDPTVPPVDYTVDV